MAIDDKAAADIARRAQVAVDGIALATEDDFNTAVDRILQGVQGPMATKRRRTLLELAKVKIDPKLSRNDVLTRNAELGIVGRETFYSKNKGWLHDPDFRLQLETLERLFIKWETLKTLREAEAERIQWRADVLSKAKKLLTRLDTLLDFPLVERVIDQDGSTVIVKPANWNWGNIPAILREADRAGRLALGMNTDQTGAKVELITEDDLPPGVSLAEAEAVQATLAKMLADAAINSGRSDQIPQEVMGEQDDYLD